MVRMNKDKWEEFISARYFITSVSVSVYYKSVYYIRIRIRILQILFNTRLYATTILSKIVLFKLTPQPLVNILGLALFEVEYARKSLVSQSIAEKLVPNQTSSIPLQWRKRSPICCTKWICDRPKCMSTLIDPRATP